MQNTIEPGAPTQDWSTADFHKSSFSPSEGQCVSVAKVPGFVAVKHSRAAQDTPRIIEFTDAEWNAFKQGVAANEF